MKRLSEQKIRELIAPTVKKLQATFPEWDDAATDRLVDMLRPCNEGKIRMICTMASNPKFVKQVVGHRAKHGARSVVSQEAKETLATEDAALAESVDVA